MEYRTRVVLHCMQNALLKWLDDLRNGLQSSYTSSIIHNSTNFHNLCVIIIYIILSVMCFRCIINLT